MEASVFDCVTAGRTCRKSGGARGSVTCAPAAPCSAPLVHLTVCKQEAGRLFSVGLFSSACPLVLSLPLPPSLLYIKKLPPHGDFPPSVLTIPDFLPFVFPSNPSETVVCPQVRWLLPSAPTPPPPPPETQGVLRRREVDRSVEGCGLEDRLAQKWQSVCCYAQRWHLRTPSVPTYATNRVG